MSKLLVPIDFTPYSKAAIRYACAIAATNGQSVDFIHAFEDHDDIYADALKNLDFMDPRVPAAQQKAEKIIKKTNEKYPAVKTSVIFYDGTLSSALEKQASKEHYDAVVISKDGGTFNLLSLFTGNKAYSMINNTKLPVLAVPSDAKEFKKDRVALLCNFKEGEIAVLKQALPIIGKNFELVLIHVNKDDKLESEVLEDFMNFSKKIKEEIGIDNFSFVTKPPSYYSQQTNNISTTIHQVLQDENVDLVLVTKSKKSIFRNLTEENIIKKMTVLLKTPKFFARIE